MARGVLDVTPGERDTGTQRADGLRRLGLGSRTPADLIAPAAVEFARDHLRLGREWARALAVTAYPRTVDPGWLAPLLEFDAPLDLSLHVVPLPTGEMVRALSHKLVQLHSSRLLDDRGGRPGAMFADWELIGVPHRLVVSDRGLKAGAFEFQGRRDAAPAEWPIARVVDLLKARLEA